MLLSCSIIGKNDVFRIMLKEGTRPRELEFGTLHLKKNTHAPFYWPEMLKGCFHASSQVQSYRTRPREHGR